MDHDAELLARARRGDDGAFAALYARHRPVADRVAARWTTGAERDDVVAESFAAVLTQIRSGRGPTVSFRAYLLTAVRHEAERRNVQQRRCEPIGEIDPVVAAHDPTAYVDVRDAWATLPVRWRQVLWRLEVEGVPPRELAEELGLSANAVSALGCRARAGLRAAYVRRSEAA